MAEHSKIEWTDATWNPITGCSVLSPGCTHCYAMRLAGTRMQRHPSRAGLTKPSKAGPVWTGEVRFNQQWLDQPLRWKRPRRIFVCAHGDLFHESVPDAWIDKVFAVMGLARWHTFQVLTKRADRMRAYLSHRDRLGHVFVASTPLPHPRGAFVARDQWPPLRESWEWPLPNVWLGVSAEDQQRADERVPHLLATPAAVRFLSAEPLLGQIRLTEIAVPDDHAGKYAGHGYTFSALERKDDLTLFNAPAHLDWVIVGGESGPGARLCHPDWKRLLRDQCVATGVAYFDKQWGEWAPVLPDAPGRPIMVRRGDVAMLPDGRYATAGDDLSFPEPFEAQGTIMRCVGKAAAGRLLDGRTWDQFPEAPPRRRRGRPMSKETGYEVVAVHEIYMGDPAPEKLAPLTPQEEARLRALLSLPEAEATTVLSRECLRVQVLRLFLTLDAERAWRRTDG